MSLLNGKWVEIFRVGDYGAKGKYTEADLDQLAADYDPAKHETPIVVGHPAADAPAFGWVESLKRVGSTLLARFRQVVPAFADLVQAGRFKKRSVSLNRTPDGKLQLRHVGFLGAQPPEIKGLADVAFSAGSGSAIEFSEGEEIPRAAFGGCRAAVMFSESAKKLAGEQKISFDQALGRIRALDWQQLHCFAAMEIAKRDGISFAEAHRQVTLDGPAVKDLDLSGAPGFFEAMKKKTTHSVDPIAARIGANETAGIRLDLRSVVFSETAEKLAKQMDIPFGEALKQVRSLDWQKILLCGAEALAKHDSISFSEAVGRVSDGDAGMVGLDFMESPSFSAAIDLWSKNRRSSLAEALLVESMRQRDAIGV
jgi:hypothetical protein